MKGIIFIKTKFLKSVMFCDSKYATNKETKKTVSSIITTLAVSLLKYSSKTQSTIALSITEAKYISLSECAQEAKFVNMLLEERSEVQRLSIVYEDNLGSIFFENNRQVGMLTKNIDIRHHFLRYMVE